MKRNLKQTLEIAETAADPKTKLQARAIANDCYRYIMVPKVSIESYLHFDSIFYIFSLGFITKFSSIKVYVGLNMLRIVIH
jgi:hypothetical protein